MIAMPDSFFVGDVGDELDGATFSVKVEGSASSLGIGVSGGGNGRGGV